jgi:hypothetical protein
MLAQLSEKATPCFKKSGSTSFHAILKNAVFWVFFLSAGQFPFLPSG